MAVQRYVDILARRKWVVLLVTLGALAAAIAGSYLQQPTYTASVTVRVAQASTGSTDYAEYYYADRLLKTYAEILKSRPFLIEVINRLNLSITTEDLAKRVKVDVVLNTELIKVSVDDAQPANAAAIANLLASLLIERSQELLLGGAKSARALLEDQLIVAEDNLERDRGALQALLTHSAENTERIEEQRAKIGLDEEIYANLLKQYEDARISEASRANSVTVAEPAVEPRKPSKPRPVLNIVLGLLLGLCTGLVLAFVIENLDASLHTVGDLEAVARMPVVGVLPQAGSARRKREQPLLFTLENDQASAEAYRLLRARLFSGGQSASPKTILVTSPEAGVGKSTVTANLATAIAAAGQRVIVIDADFRRSSLHEFFGLANVRGLSDVLLGSADLDAVLGETVQSGTNPNLRVLTSGPQPLNPSELLETERMTKVIGALAARADRVLVDSAPLLAVADGVILAPQVDNVLLVTARDETTSKRLETAYQLLDRIGAQVLGVVFNKAQGDERYYYYQYPMRSKQPTRIARVWRAVAVTVGILVMLAALLGATWFLRPEWLQSIPGLSSLLFPSTPAVDGEGSLQPAVALPEMPNATPEAAASELVAPATRTPLLPRPAFIASAEQGLRDGIFLYDDPVTAVPGRVWLPAGSSIEVLEVDIYGRIYYGTRRWFRIQCVLDGRTYVGYVPSGVVIWSP